MVVIESLFKCKYVFICLDVNFSIKYKGDLGLKYIFELILVSFELGTKTKIGETRLGSSS